MRAAAAVKIRELYDDHRQAVERGRRALAAAARHLDAAELELQGHALRAPRPLDVRRTRR